MHLIEQQFPFMGVLRTEQIMDAYAVARRIEQAGENDVKNVCIRFYALNNGTDIWISGEAFNNAGGMIEFLTDVVDLDEDLVTQLCESPWEVTATDGDGLELAFIGKVFNWQQFGLITCALEEYDADVLRAARDAGVDYDQIGNKYKGQYKDFLTFVTELWNEMYQSELPDFAKNLIDYAIIEEDWNLEGQYVFVNGYVFDVNG